MLLHVLQCPPLQRRCSLMSTVERLRNPDLHLSSCAHRPHGVGAVSLSNLEEETRFQRGEVTGSEPCSWKVAQAGPAEPEAHAFGRVA